MQTNLVNDLVMPILYSALEYWYLPVIALIILFLKTPFVKGWIGEKLVHITVKNIVKDKNGILLNNLILPAETDTTQVDHVVMIPSGIYVIETKNMKGWIFGDAKSKNWTQQIYKHKSKFQNPLHQNFKHLKTIQSLLNIEEPMIHNIVVFVGSAEFKTEKPNNVFGLFKLRTFLKKQNDDNLTTIQIEEFATILTTTKLANSIKNNRQHVKKLTEKYESTNTCPKCSSHLVERTVKKGERAGQTFFGCSAFPKCRYTKN